MGLILARPWCPKNHVIISKTKWQQTKEKYDLRHLFKRAQCYHGHGSLYFEKHECFTWARKAQMYIFRMAIKRIEENKHLKKKIFISVNSSWCVLGTTCNVSQEWPRPVSVLWKLKAFCYNFYRLAFPWSGRGVCSCFTCTMPRIHCAPTRCPLVHIVNSCSPKYGLSRDQPVSLPSWWKLPGSRHWLFSKAKHKQEATTVSNSLFFHIHPPGTHYCPWHWAATFIRTTNRHYPQRQTSWCEKSRDCFSWLIRMATIYKIKYIFCTSRDLLRPKDWYFPQITKSFQGSTSTSPMSSLLQGPSARWGIVLLISKTTLSKADRACPKGNYKL